MLEGKLYIESLDNDDSFVVDESFYADENAYIMALEAEFNNNNKLFNETPIETKNSFNYDEQILKYDEKKYISCECKLVDENIDTFIYHNVNSDSFQLKILLNFDELDEDFEYEMKLWRDIHNNTFKTLSNLADFDIRLEELPYKSLKFSFINLKGDVVYSLLEDCTFLELKNNELLIRVKKLTFIKSL